MLAKGRLSDRFNYEKDLQNLVNGKVQESRTLEYKRQEALDDHVEMAKDVSSFANSAGGIIIYGIAEDSSHYPQNIEWVDKRKEKGDPKETIENVILSRIHPRINDFIVKAITSEKDTSKIVLVVDIPESPSAPHMANNRYFKRLNFQAQAMEDDEVRALMGRRVRPNLKVKLKFEDAFLKFDESGLSHPLKLNLAVRNTGKALAKYICIFVDFPQEMVIAIENTHYNQVDWARMDIPVKRLVCINNTAVIHPTTSLDWSFVELKVRFPAETDGLIWTTVYAKDCPEKVGGIKYRIQNYTLITEELPEAEYY